MQLFLRRIIPACSLAVGLFITTPFALGDVVLHFVPVKQVSADVATRDLLANANGKHPSLTAVPDPRTNRVVLTSGSAEAIDWAIKFLDKYYGEQPAHGVAEESE